MTSAPVTETERRCPKCSRNILQQAPNGAVGEILRIDGVVHVAADGACMAKCYFCKQLVPVPLVKTATPIVIRRRIVIDRTGSPGPD